MSAQELSSMGFRCLYPSDFCMPMVELCLFWIGEMEKEQKLAKKELWIDAVLRLVEPL